MVVEIYREVERLKGRARRTATLRAQVNVLQSDCPAGSSKSQMKNCDLMLNDDDSFC
jgi:hypothetical protein